MNWAVLILKRFACSELKKIGKYLHGQNTRPWAWLSLLWSQSESSEFYPFPWFALQRVSATDASVNPSYFIMKMEFLLITRITFHCIYSAYPSLSSLIPIILGSSTLKWNELIYFLYFWWWVSTIDLGRYFGRPMTNRQSLHATGMVRQHSVGKRGPFSILLSSSLVKAKRIFWKVGKHLPSPDMDYEAGKSLSWRGGTDRWHPLRVLHQHRPRKGNAFTLLRSETASSSRREVT